MPDRQNELHALTVRMTQAMFDDSQELVFQARIPHVEWIRRCMAWGIMNPGVIANSKCPDQYKVQPRGTPNREY